jgi:hypothetical protein
MDLLVMLLGPNMHYKTVGYGASLAGAFAWLSAVKSASLASCASDRCEGSVIQLTGTSEVPLNPLVDRTNITLTTAAGASAITLSGAEGLGLAALIRITILVSEARTSLSAIEFGISGSPLTSGANFVARSKSYELGIFTTLSAATTIRPMVQSCVFRVGETPVIAPGCVGIWNFIRNIFQVEPRWPSSRIGVATSNDFLSAVTTLNLGFVENELCWDLPPSSPSPPPSPTSSDPFAISSLKGTSAIDVTALAGTVRHPASHVEGDGLLSWSRKIGATGLRSATIPSDASRVQTLSEVPVVAISIPSGTYGDATGSNSLPPSLSMTVGEVIVPDNPTGSEKDAGGSVIPIIVGVVVGIVVGGLLAGIVVWWVKVKKKKEDSEDSLDGVDDRRSEMRMSLSLGP